MKKLFLVLTLITTMVQAQEVKQIPQISVSGEGKIKVTPDEAIIKVAFENTGKEAAEVKKKNDEIVDKVLKLIKQRGIPTSDYQTQRVNLYKNYDYEKKKYSYQANQTILAEAEMILTETLLNPEINFELNFPNNSTIKTELQVYYKMQEFLFLLSILKSIKRMMFGYETMDLFT